MNRTKPSSQSRVAVDVALTNYFLLRFFKEHDHRFRHRVRILFGGSEEIALNDIKWFVANIGAPYQAIVTDGPFPVNNIQKDCSMWMSNCRSGRNCPMDKRLIWHRLGYRLRECGKRTDYRQWWFDYTGE